MIKLKEERIDILKCFCENNVIYYYDPSQMWRMNCDFTNIIQKIKNYEEAQLESCDLEAQRSLLRLKIQYNWLVVEMIQPTFKIYKHLTVLPTKEEPSLEDSFDSDFDNIMIESLTLQLRTKNLKKIVDAGIDKWELKALDLLKFDRSSYKFE